MVIFPEYQDFDEEDGTYTRRLKHDFEVELSNGWLVYGVGEIFCNLDDIENTADDDIEVKEIAISDKNDDDIPEEELRKNESLYAEFFGKFSRYMMDKAERPYGNLFKKICDFKAAV